MKRKIYLISIILLLLNISSSNANCLKLLKLDLKKRIGQAHPFLFGEKANLRLSKKTSEIQETLRALGDYKEILARKKSSHEKKLAQLLKNNSLENEFKQALLIMHQGMNNPKYLIEWVKNLYLDIVIETLLEGKTESIDSFKKTDQLSEQLSLRVILNRLESGGFSSRFEDLYITTSQLSVEQFAEVLKSKKLMLDQAYKLSDHGNIIHILQIDYMNFLMKKFGEDPLNVSKIYFWMGRQEEIILDKKTSFNTLEDGWKTLFDSFEKDLTAPEELNSLLKQFFRFNTDTFHLEKDEILKLD